MYEVYSKCIAVISFVLYVASFPEI